MRNRLKQAGSVRPGDAAGPGCRAGRLPLYVLVLVLCPALLVGCAKGGGEASGGVRTTTIAGMSRVIIPANGGQTIVVPRLMGDAHTLWSPLSPRERRRPATYVHHAVEDRLMGPLTPEQTEIMQSYLYRLTEARRGLAATVLGRAEQHMPIVLEAIERQGLPRELACLPLVESAFEPRAVSPAGAAGLWQLMPDTARRFGLTVNGEVDERFDVQKSTAAATAYLAVLHDIFGDWSLAVAAYNCGEGAMLRALERSGCRTLGDLSTHCLNLPPESRPLQNETLAFVPQFTAAVAIMTRSGDFGFSARPLRLESGVGGAACVESATFVRRDLAVEPERRAAVPQGGASGIPQIGALGGSQSGAPGAPQSVGTGLPRAGASGARRDAPLSLSGRYDQDSVSSAPPPAMKQIP